MEMCFPPSTVDSELDSLDMPEDNQDCFFEEVYKGFPFENPNIKQEAMTNFTELQSQKTRPSPLNSNVKSRLSDSITERDLQMGLVDFTATGDYHCVKCGRILAGRKQGTRGIISHLLLVHKLDKELAVLQCTNEKILKKQEDLKLRQAREKANRPKKKWPRRIPKPTPCPNCNKIFQYTGDLTKHMNSVHLKLKSKCPICQKEFLVNSMYLHLKTHGERSHLCYLCGKSYNTQVALRHHFNITHNPNPPDVVKPKIKNHKCNLCDKSFEFANRLKIHKLRHEDKRIYTCDICDKKYKVRSDLTKHIRYHQLRKDKPCKCPFCEKRAATKRNMKIHLIYTHKLSKEEASTLAGIKTSTSESNNVSQSM